MGWRFPPIYTFFSRVFSPVKNAPPLRFRCRHPKICLLDFLKMLDLALSQIYTRVFHLWKPIDLDGVWVGDSRLYQLLSSRKFSHLRCWDLNQCLANFLKMLLLALPQMCTRVFNLWKSIDLNSAWARDSRPYLLSFLL